jgi:hypothetical protein
MTGGGLEAKIFVVTELFAGLGSEIDEITVDAVAIVAPSVPAGFAARRKTMTASTALICSNAKSLRSPAGWTLRCQKELSKDLDSSYSRSVK